MFVCSSGNFKTTTYAWRNTIETKVIYITGKKEYNRMLSKSFLEANRIGSKERINGKKKKQINN